MCAMTGLNILSLALWVEGVRRTGEGLVGCQSNVQHEINWLPELVSGSHQMLQLACTGSEESHNDLKSLYKAQVAGAAATLPKRTYLPSKRAAFTLAEVLITIGIIGIVAAMTMPSLIANYRKKQVVAQLKKVYSTISQAYEMSKNENGSSGDWIDTSQSINTENVKKYVQTYWLPYFKSLQECSNRGDCSYTYAKAPNGDGALNLKRNNRYTIILSDGTLIAFVPFSWTEEKGTFWGKDQKFYIDLNGAKRPNVLGKDVFLFMIYNDKVTSYCPTKDESTINSNCSKTGNGHCCSTKIMRDGWEIKDDYPW